MRASGIIQVVPKYNDKCPYKRHTQQTYREKGRPWEDGSRDWSNGATCQRMPEVAGGEEKFSPRAFGEDVALPTP